MISIPHKAKHFLLVLTKVLVVGIAFYYLYSQFQEKSSTTFHFIALNLTVLSFIVILLFSILNWFFEFLKWKNLVSSFHKITFKQSVEQSLGSLTASIFTPNRVGEYIAKCLYFSKEKTKRIIFLNFLGNFTQMMVTVLFGMVGMLFYFVLSSYDLNFLYDENGFLFWLPIIVAFLFLIFIFFFKRVEFYGYSIEKLKVKMQLFPARKHFVNVQYSFFRYLIFSHQFYFLLLIFQVEIPYPDAMLTIFTMYFLASIIPSIHLMDVVIKGSVAVFLFGKLGVNEWVVLSITMLMWILNLVIPVLIGSFYVLKYNPNQKV
jgi:uncharacterized membrane protein YbhN (UPF0104 family)